MKIKPLYIYGILAVAAVLVLIFLTNRQEEPSVNNMPQDDVHSQFRNNQVPGKENISGEFYQQMEALRLDVEKNPDDTTKLKAYADYLTAAHQFDSALPVYQEILDKDPERTDIYFALTFIYYNQKDMNKAEEVTNKVLSYDKNNLQAKYNLGAIAASKGENDKAKDIWTKLSSENPGTREAKLAEEGLGRLK
jgi:cytochrome c-type biogenesis protein CcmH/NrfG